MGKFIALLRAINVGGTGKVAIADLRKLVEAEGFTDVKSYIASGNLVFEGAGKATDLEARLEAAAAKTLGLKADWILRTPAEWRALIEASPFPDFAKASPSKYLVTVFKTQPDPKRLAEVEAIATLGEEMKLVGRALYICFPEGAGKSKLAGAAIEKRLGARGTARNWNTVLKLAEMAGA
ncbi:MAG TPA: DUF1697 domain-containing protein [Caulobacter sp.]|nr:DUF1697 domain-containing protein [Caulobacter sp.]